MKNRPAEIGNDDQSLAEHRDKILIFLLNYIINYNYLN